MSDTIKLVQGDNRPFITLTLRDASKAAINVQGATVTLAFRKSGTTQTLTTLACLPVTDGADGRVRFYFPGTTLDVPAGNYEGEIEVTFANGDKQTVYDVLKFQVRAQFQTT